jgi:hypothetical protein
MWPSIARRCQGVANLQICLLQSLIRLFAQALILRGYCSTTFRFEFYGYLFPIKGIVLTVFVL